MVGLVFSLTFPVLLAALFTWCGCYHEDQDQLRSGEDGDELDESKSGENGDVESNSERLQQLQSSH